MSWVDVTRAALMQGFFGGGGVSLIRNIVGGFYKVFCFFLQGSCPWMSCVDVTRAAEVRLPFCGWIGLRVVDGRMKFLMI